MYIAAKRPFPSKKKYIHHCYLIENAEYRHCRTGNRLEGAREIWDSGRRTNRQDRERRVPSEMNVEEEMRQVWSNENVGTAQMNRGNKAQKRRGGENHIKQVMTQILTWTLYTHTHVFVHTCTFTLYFLNQVLILIFLFKVPKAETHMIWKWSLTISDTFLMDESLFIFSESVC